MFHSVILAVKVKLSIDLPLQRRELLTLKCLLPDDYASRRLQLFSVSSCEEKQKKGSERRERMWIRDGQRGNRFKMI